MWLPQWLQALNPVPTVQGTSPREGNVTQTTSMPKIFSLPHLLDLDLCSDMGVGARALLAMPCLILQGPHKWVSKEHGKQGFVFVQKHARPKKTGPWTTTSSPDLTGLGFGEHIGSADVLALRTLGRLIPPPPPL